jgi:DnaJ-class molecular chaperone
MKKVNQVKCVLIDFENSSITFKEATDKIMNIFSEETCKVCKGTGIIVDKNNLINCSTCSGSGKNEKYF